MATTPKLSRKDVLQWTPKAPHKDPWLRCRTTKGLCLHVRPNKDGQWARTFYVLYRWGGRPLYRALGPVGHPAWTLEQAEEEVRRLRRRVQQAKLRGEPNPLRLVNVEPEPEITLAQLAGEYQRLTTKSDRVKREDEGRWSNHVLPFKPPGSRAVLGRRAVADLTVRDLEELKAGMAGKPVAFNLVRRMLRHALNKAKAWGHIPDSKLAMWSNPAAEVEEYPTKKRERVFHDRELRAIHHVLNAKISDAVDAWRTHGRRLTQRRARLLVALRIFLRNPMRPGELRRTQRPFIHWRRSLIDLPEVKGDRKVVKGRIVALGSRTLEDIRLLDELAEGCPWLLPSPKKDGPASRSCFRKIWGEVCQAADRHSGTQLGGDDTATPYVFRHTGINAHSEAGIDGWDMADLAGHAERGETTRIYRHTDSQRLVRVAQQLEDHLEAILQNRV